MPVTTEIDTKAGVVVTTGSGEITPSDLTVLDAILRHPDFRPGMGFVWDARNAVFRGLSSEAIRQFALRASIRIEARGRGRSAIVVSEELGYGIARMAHGHSGDMQVEQGIFQDFDEAMRWASGASLENGENG
jgi:hypothetical protein